MRRATLVTASFLMTTLAACGTGTAAPPGQVGAVSAASATPGTSSSEGATETAVAVSPADYDLLARNANGFFRAAYRAEQRFPDETPTNVEELRRIVDYSFDEGVDLEVFDDAEQLLCFTGPHSTYLTLSEPKGVLRRTLGTGECDYSTGDIVLELRMRDDAPDASLFYEKTIKGAALVDRVPALAEFADVLNQAVVPS